MKICQVCTKPFAFGKSSSCSIDCYLEELQFRLDECFKKDKSHITFLKDLV